MHKCVLEAPLKPLAARFSSTDLGKMVLLGLLVLLLALGGMELSRVVAAKMLRDAAQAEASAWAASLVDSADDDIPAIIDSLVPSEKTKNLLKQASEVGGIYRYKVWNRSGDLCFVSDQKNPPGCQRPLHNNRDRESPTLFSPGLNSRKQDSASRQRIRLILQSRTSLSNEMEWSLVFSRCISI